MTNRCATLVTFCIVLGGKAFAAAPPPVPIKPRVMVIVDTSKSMELLTKADIAAGLGNAGTQVLMTDPNGDYDPLVNPLQSCANKFCAAKKVVYNTLPNYVDDAVIGVTSYYQYLFRKDGLDNRKTTCSYDVLLPSGLPRTFASTADLTGGGNTDVGPYGVGGSVANRFPDNLSGRCLDVTATPLVTQGTRYQVYKTAAVAGTVDECYVYSPTAAPRTFAAGTAPVGCDSNVSYTNLSPVLTTVGGMAPATPVSTVSAFFELSQGPVSTGPCTNLTATVTPPWAAGVLGAACTTASPCAFTAQPGPVLRTSSRAWYGFFGPTAPAPLYSGGLPYNLSSRIGAIPAPTPNVVTGAVDIPVGNTCSPSVNNFTGDLTAYGMTAASISTQLQANATVQLLTGQTLQQPTPGNSLTRCEPGWPCDVTSLPSTPLPAPVPGPPTIIYANTPPAGAGEVITATTTDAFEARLTNGTSVCPTPGLVGSNGTAPAGTTWNGPNPAGCSGAGRQSCSFTAGAPTTGTASGCGPLVSYTGIAPTGVCAANGKAYGVAPGAVTPSLANVSVTVAGATCPSVTTLTSATQGGLSWTGYMGVPMPLTPAGQTPAPNQTATGTDPGTPPAGFAGTPTEAPSGGPVGIGPEAFVPPSCPAAGTLVTLSPGVMGRSVGIVATGNTCPGEKPCNQCRAEPVTFTWSRPASLCNYTAPRLTATVDQSTTLCRYDRQRFNLTFTPPQLKRCPYTVPARRVDFDVPVDNVCLYSTVRRTLERTVYNYTYEYRTNGTELALQWKNDIPNKTYCADPYAGSFATDCPATVSNCTGAIPGSVCKLTWGAARGAGGSGAITAVPANIGSGRFTSHLGSDFIAGKECSEVFGSLPPSPNLYRTASVAPAVVAPGFCTNVGALPDQPQFALISDWYAPTTVNANAADSCPNFPLGSCSPANWLFSSSNTSNKDQGWGAKGGTPSLQPTASPTLVTIPDDAAYSATAQADAIKKAMGKCVQPSAASVTGTTWTPEGGICMAAFTNPRNGSVPLPGWNRYSDVTPLYGSLRNTGKYLLDRLDSDPDAACRDYYIVLATDGKENTPQGYNVSQLTTLLNDYRTKVPSSPSGKKVSIKTFVIGFGTDVSEEADLDAMAAAGGTATAYKADSLTALQAALNSVFSIISTGTYTRSKPTISSDGERIYTAQYERASNSPEWRGKLYAFGIDANTGDPALKWEYAEKLNAQPDSSRVLKARVGTTTVDFAEGSAALRAGLSVATDFAATAAAVPTTTNGLADLVVRFIRNPSLTEKFEDGSDRLSRAGAIFRSGIVVVGKSPFASEWAGTSGANRAAYQTFIDNVTGTRPARVLVGANDGMLHGLFERDPACGVDEAIGTCANGKEAWGFMPSEVLPDLFRTRAGNQSFINGLASVADVCANATGDAKTCTAAQWKTIAIPTLRDGGRSLFALDVSTGGTPTYLWNFDHPMLGFTDSSPAIGRVQHGSEDRFVAIFGGGAKQGARGAPLTGQVGQSAFVVDTFDGKTLQTGAKFSAYTKFFQGAAELDVPAEMVARPAMWRRPGSQYLHSAILPASNGTLYVLRFEQKDTAYTATPPERARHTDVKDWAPDEFFDPTSNRNRDDPNGDPAPVRRVVEVDNGPTIAPTYSLNSVGTLPLAVAPPILNRPKVASIVDPRGDLPDYFVGTGFTPDPDNVPSPSSYDINYFYAIHDDNRQPKGARNDGRPMWVARFIDPREQVVSEPALINGAVIVATYLPSTSACGQPGDTLLYAFDPKSGALTPALTYPQGYGYTGQNSVVRYKGIGIPSDLIGIGNNIYFTASASPTPQKQQVRPAISSGDVRSYRRLK